MNSPINKNLKNHPTFAAMTRLNLLFIYDAFIDFFKGNGKYSSIFMRMQWVLYYVCKHLL